MSWLILIIASVFEVTWAIGLKYSECVAFGFGDAHLACRYGLCRLGWAWRCRYGDTGYLFV